MSTSISILLITDRSPWGDLAHRFAQVAGAAVTRFVWAHGTTLDAAVIDRWCGDWIVGFKADYIVSREQLRLGLKGAINFHPGPPDLRGVGTYEVALRDGREHYGVTCHHMTVHVDAGQIVDTRHFPVAPGTTPFVLQEIAAAHLYLLYTEIIRRLLTGTALPSSSEQWSGPLHTWAQLDSPVAGSRP